MTNRKNLIFWGTITLVGAGLAFYSYFSRPAKYVGPLVSPNVEQSPASTLAPIPTLSPSPKTAGGGTTPVPTEEPFSSLNGIKAPATCQVGGEVAFYDEGTFASKDSKISWQNVDSQGRLINWHISPNDNLKIGPNIFANLDVPNGQYDNLTVRLPEKPAFKNYLLTASITYGQFVQGDLKVKEVNCSGQVKVNLNF